MPKYEVVVRVTVMRTVIIQASSTEGAEGIAEAEAAAQLGGYDPQAQTITLLLESNHAETGQD
jgi:hypothetical protein